MPVLRNKERSTPPLRSVTIFNGDALQVFGKKKTEMTTHLNLKVGKTREYRIMAIIPRFQRGDVISIITTRSFGHFRNQ